MIEIESSKYDFKLCTSAADLSAAYNLRIEVFHDEQKFSKETEVDRYKTVLFAIIFTSFIYTVRYVSSYDPISAHFIVISKIDNMIVATVRLFPYPSSHQPSTHKNDSLNTDQDHEQFPLGAVRSEAEIVKEFLKEIKSAVVVGDQGIRGVKLSRLAVKKAMRGKCVGALAVKEAEKWLQRILSGTENLKAFTVILSSQMQAKRFYEKIGYTSQGEPYDEEGMLHMLCLKRFSV